MATHRLSQFLLASIALAPAGAYALDVELVNRTDIAAPIDSNGPTSQIADVTPDGRYALFPSYASNLLAGDTNRVADLYLHDATAGTIERVNLGSGAIQSNAPAGGRAGISDDGRFVVFDSAADNLVATPTFGRRQIYLRDRVAGTTTALTQSASGDSANPQTSADARYVAFDTNAAFDSNDTNGVRDIYRLDRQTGLFELISISQSGALGNADSIEPQISADGSSVAFKTRATNLVPNDTNAYSELLLRKPAGATTQRISRRASGMELSSDAELAPLGALSADGRYVLMNTSDPAEPTDTNYFIDGYLFDSLTSEVRRVTLNSAGQPLNDFSPASALSRDGARIAMSSGDGDVLPGIGGGGPRVFIRELGSGAIRHVTFRTGGEQSWDQALGAGISDDGNIVVAHTVWNGFVADDTNGMEDVIRQAAPTSPAQRLSAPTAGATALATNRDSGRYGTYAASADGRFIALSSSANNLVADDSNNISDIFVRDRMLGTIERVSVRSDGAQSWCGGNNPSISDDGRYVAFDSCAPLDLGLPSTHRDIYVHDRQMHTTRLVILTPQGSPANGSSEHASLSADGRYLAFDSCATDLVANDTNSNCDIFVRDLVAGTTTLATRGANANTSQPLISRDGQHVAFQSSASNLVPGDTNNQADVFVFGRSAQSLERVSVNSQEQAANAPGHLKSVSDDGSQIVFFSRATNFAGGSAFGAMYVRDRTTGTTDVFGRLSSRTYNEAGGAAAISGDGRRIAYSTNIFVDSPQENELMLFDRDTARAHRLRTLDKSFGIESKLVFTGNGNELLLASRDNSLTDDDGNNHFCDVFVFGQIRDYVFADGFETQPE